LPVRSLADYVTALRRHHQRQRGKVEMQAYDEDWESSFSLVEDGARVGNATRIHDSVVLRGARVESGAVVVRSVVGPQGIVKKGRMVVEHLIGPEHGRARIGRE